VRLLQEARAFVFAGEEDFGIALVEAQAAGTPLICFGRGGAADIVREGETGLLFAEQSARGGHRRRAPLRGGGGPVPARSLPRPGRGLLQRSLPRKAGSDGGRMISLVVATMGRVAELRALLDSLLDAQGAPFEVLLVDQNADARLDPVVAEYASRLTLRHLRLAVPHANAARNLGLRHARGALVGFPDDDCTLHPGMLGRVAAAFAAEPGLAVLTGPAEAPGGGLGSGRWRAADGPITTADVWTSVIEFNLWLRRDVALALGGFDEAMGPGSRFGSAEGQRPGVPGARAGHGARYAARCGWCIRTSG
jgi:hypothetical protein